MKTIAPKGNSPELAAAKIGCSRAKVFMEIKAGRLEARKMGKRTIILDEAIDAYLHSLPVRKVSALDPVTA